MAILLAYTTLGAIIASCCVRNARRRTGRPPALGYVILMWAILVIIWPTIVVDLIMDMLRKRQ